LGFFESFFSSLDLGFGASFGSGRFGFNFLGDYWVLFEINLLEID
jgi:hypothetical protein